MTTTKSINAKKTKPNFGDNFLEAKNIAKIRASLTPLDKKKLLAGMILTRATDNALKKIFLSGEISYLSKGFQGKGFRSLGQEAIFGAGYFLESSDVAAPLIRDLGLYLSLSNNDVESAINAQAGKSGLPSDGRDLHLGDFKNGLLMPAAPLAIATCTLLGIAMSFQIRKEKRVALSFIGEGGTSLGEWHEAINFAAVKKLPMIFCVQNNQTALSTPAKEQSLLSSFANKALAYGIPALSLDGTDIENVAAHFKAAADFARFGHGPVLIELVSMRMCGHAHHDDSLYLGHDPVLDWHIADCQKSGYVNQKLYKYWQKKDCLNTYAKTLIKNSIISEHDFENFKNNSLKKAEDAIKNIKEKPWPSFSQDDAKLSYKKPIYFNKPSTNSDKNYNFNAKGLNYLQAIEKAIIKVLSENPESLVLGEDVAAPYGNAFMMFKNAIKSHKKQLINTPISENAIVGACVGLGLCGIKAIGEMQFNDFVASAMNQVVNNAAKTFFRTGQNVPMVLRMPYGGLRRAGPFHSQDTSPWFARCSGLKIFAPSTPKDAYHMLIEAVNDPDPVLFYEHIALYRDPSIKQIDIEENPGQMKGATIIQEGSDLSLISYGAFVHKAFAAANILLKDHKIKTEVIDLRYLKPIDTETCNYSIKKTSRALLVGEDSKDGSILQNLSAKLYEDIFSYLDAPIKVLGSRDIPVPYAPSLEDQYLLNEKDIVNEAIKLMAF